jgi:phospholipase C
LIFAQAHDLAFQQRFHGKEQVMRRSRKSLWKLARLGLCTSTSVAAMLALGVSGRAEDDDARHDGMRTRTPIKHVMIVIPENRSFDHLFGLYRPREGQTISNLLSKGILKQDGSPGPNFSEAAQFQVLPQPKYYVGVDAVAKTPYVTLPPPDLGGAPNAQSDTAAPFKNTAEVAPLEPLLKPADLVLLTTGATGFPGTEDVDTRVTGATHLPNGPFQLTGPTLPYDAYTGDTTHRFYQMWQQSDCSTANATRHNPTGCLNDLYPFVITTFSTADNGVGNSMAFLNVHQGDAPFLKELADRYTLSDNFHQAMMGGTGPNHVLLGTGDVVFFSDGRGNPLPPPLIPAAAVGLPPTFPPISLVANPDPVPGTNNRYKNDPLGALGEYVNCSDKTQPGVPAIVDYLATLPYEISSNCAAGHFYAVNNFFPGFHPDGRSANPASAHPASDGSDIFFVPPSNVRTIGDALNEKAISWAYYGGAFNAAVNLAKGSTNPLDAIGAAYCQICNPFQYATSTMGDPAQRAAHLKDLVDLVDAIDHGTLPAVSFVKPDGLLDGHPASSKLGLFEALLKNILDRLHANRQLEAETAVFIVFDEGGGYYDSGYIQPLDFFGDGPRIPFIVVSPFSRGGRVVHTYYDHVSILKFIERNWRLQPLTARSRDNLPNPVAHGDNPYVPRNSPAIGDLFDMFDFDRDRDRDDDRDGNHRDRD